MNSASDVIEQFMLKRNTLPIKLPTEVLANSTACFSAYQSLAGVAMGCTGAKFIGGQIYRGKL